MDEQQCAETVEQRLAAVESRHARHAATSAANGTWLPARWGDIGLLLDERCRLVAERDRLQGETERLAAASAELGKQNLRLRAELAGQADQLRRQRLMIDELRGSQAGDAQHLAVLRVAAGGPDGDERAPQQTIYEAAVAEGLHLQRETQS